MQLKQIETFLTVAEAGSFTKAGEKLFISSSAVAQQIGSLEADIGAKLFSRTTHGVSLTPIGCYLSKEGRVLVEKGHEIRDHIENMRFEACLGEAADVDLQALGLDEPELTVRMTQAASVITGEKIRSGTAA